MHNTCVREGRSWWKAVEARTRGRTKPRIKKKSKLKVVLESFFISSISKSPEGGSIQFGCPPPAALPHLSLANQRKPPKRMAPPPKRRRSILKLRFNFYAKNLVILIQTLWASAGNPTWFKSRGRFRPQFLFPQGLAVPVNGSEQAPHRSIAPSAGATVKRTSSIP